jgi:CubicO group peptidase (beta-lactamase class C family)
MLRTTFLPALLLGLSSHLCQAGAPELAAFDHDAHPDLRSVLVMHKGAIIAERYYNGATAESLHDVRSAGKSITALLVGTAVDRGLIHDVSDRVDRYWSAAKGSAVGAVPLADILTMRSGLAAFDADAASPGNEDKMDEAQNTDQFILAIPRAVPPGTLYRYNSLTAHVAGITVQQASGRDLEDYARTALFAPIGITQWQWARDGSGRVKGQGNLSLRTRDLGKIGQMVLDRGVFDGRRVLSEQWIAAMLAPRHAIANVDRYADSYGYFWYSKTQMVDGRPIVVHFASGNGGNKIYVVPALGEVIVITSSAYGKGYGQLRSETILKAILAQRGAP